MSQAAFTTFKDELQASKVFSTKFTSRTDAVKCDMPSCFFVSDLHGKPDRYHKLFSAITQEKPDAVFIGGDLLPAIPVRLDDDQRFIENFIQDFLSNGFRELQQNLKEEYPQVFLIMGNDDARTEEEEIIQGMVDGLWQYIHNKRVRFGPYLVFGYAYVPPTPFLLKDWERYDVSMYIDPGCIPLEDGLYTLKQPEGVISYSTIQQDLVALTDECDLSQSIFLFHTPPYQTKLDRAALDDKVIDHAPVDIHVGSIAVKRLIEKHQPLITLHGHIHESSRLTGAWKEVIGKTYAFNAAHNGLELSLIRFDPENPSDAVRELI